MTADSWIIQSLGAENVRKSAEEAGRRRLRKALGVEGAAALSDDQLRFVANGLELRVFDLLDGDDTLAFVYSRVHGGRDTPVRIGNRQ